MNQKLTLSLKKSVIEEAKEYAKQNHISLSRLFESYLQSLIEKKTKEVEITPLVESLIGVAKLPADFDVRENYTDYLMEKYK